MKFKKGDICVIHTIQYKKGGNYDDFRTGSLVIVGLVRNGWCGVVTCDNDSGLLVIDNEFLEKIDSEL